MTLSRRSFLEAAAATAAVAAGCAAPATGPDRKDAPPVYTGPIVDTHEHLWDLNYMKPPWLAGLEGDGKAILGKSHVPADYDAAVKGLGIAKAVYMEVDVGDADLVREADYVTKICAEGKTPMVAAVIGARPDADDFAAYLDRFKGSKHVKGVRQCLHGGNLPPKHCLTDKYVRGVQLLGERGLSFDLVLRNDQLEFGAELIERCPKTRFILDHCGNPNGGSADKPTWEKGLEKVANAGGGRAMCKISGLYAHIKAAENPPEKIAPLVRKTIALFGWNRVMFAGDWPVVNLGASFAIWTSAVKEIVRSDPPDDQRRLFHDNAVKFYGLA